MTEYAIITPIKNEKGNIEKTIQAVTQQKQLPMEWIIIDDSSNDGSELIIREAAESYPWIKIYTAENLEDRDYSSRVVNLFNYGFNKLINKVDYVSKLDADVHFAPNFYLNILHAFNENPKLGIASGHLTENNIPEKTPPSSFTCTRGATKVYRMRCLEDIGGMICFQGWDTLDNVAARAKGWEVEIIPEYFEHLKKEGSKVGNAFFSQFRTGFYNGSIPYYFPYFVVKSFSKIVKYPFIIGTILQIAGYCKGRYLNKRRPFPEFIVDQLHFEQKQTLRSLFSI